MLKMVRRCILCGGRLRTGIKYCHKCKSGNLTIKRKQRENSKEAHFLLTISLFMVIGGIVLLFKDWQWLIIGILLLLGGIALFYATIKDFSKKTRKLKEKGALI